MESSLLVEMVCTGQKKTNLRTSTLILTGWREPRRSELKVSYLVSWWQSLVNRWFENWVL